MTDTADHPLVTLAILGFRHESYIREAITAAFAQTYTPLEIILSDDHSPDRTYEIMREMASAYTGKHRVVLRQNQCNVGLIAHVNTMFDVASGEYIIAAAGDDISEPNRTSALVEAVQGEPLLVHSKCTFVDGEGKRVAHEEPTLQIKSGDLAQIARSRGLYIGATGMWHKDLVRVFGPISHAGAYEDLVFGYRAALAGRVGFVDQPLVRYRVGSGMSTASAAGSTRRHEAARAALQQRRDDTMTFAPDRADLLRAIDHQIALETAIILYHTDRKRLVLGGSLFRWPVLSAILLKSIRKARQTLTRRRMSFSLKNVE